MSIFQFRNIKRNTKRIITGVFFLLPISVVMILFFFIPAVQSLYYSLFDWQVITGDKTFIGLENFKALKTSPGMSQSILNTIRMFLGSTILINTVSLTIALLLDTKERTYFNRNILRSMFFFPAMLSGIVAAQLWKIMYFYDGGVINSILISLKLRGLINDWLGQPGLVMISMITAYAWFQLSISTIIYLAGLQNISLELYESAKIDGANSWSAFKHITFPLLAPSITLNVIYVSINALKAFDFPFNLTQGGPGYYSMIMSERIYFYGFKTMEFGLSSALSVILVSIILIIALAQVLILRKREEIY